MFAILTIIVLLFSVILHEVAHGSVALHLGDPTAKNFGRLTLNPIKHIDMFGTIILPALLFIVTHGQGPIIGWAKPVPVNPFNFRDRRWGSLKVSLAGPATNLLIAVIFGLAIRFILLPYPVVLLFSLIVFYNFLLGIFNLVPIPPLDGSHILFSLLPDKFNQLKIYLQQYGLFILVFFIFLGIGWIFQLTSILFTLVTKQPLIL